jgi:hypothetical protein
LVIGDFRYWHEPADRGRAELVRSAPCISDINLFRYRQGVIDLDAEIQDRAFDLSVPKQELNGSEVACPAIDQGSFCAAQGMRPKQPRVEPNTADPLGD